MNGSDSSNDTAGASNTDEIDGAPVDTSGAYQVLARKYRPTTFSELIGQDILVRTLTNAFKLGRLAHAFILTGVRGVGKTTTARIIARAFNCVGPDGDGAETAEPCGQCEHCRAIAEDRHVDVMEMDAASRTGVDDIRELIDGVRYRPTSARYKVYIIDEVHMLSRNAFNALLKTLEEPPAHVKFVFATTEIRKVPVTVLSRCQRFDLARVDTETLSQHFSIIAEKEGASISEPAIGLISRAADGSVRDGLSLLDQAISQSDGGIGEDQVRAMLGLADRSVTFSLLENVMAGRVPEALEVFDQLHRDGGDPTAILEDMLEIIHWLTRIKVAPEAADDVRVAETERVRGRDMEQRLSMPVLARAWQMLLKGLQEVRYAPSARQAAEMALVRLAYSSTLPTPEDALKSLPQNDGEPASTTSAPTTAAAADTPPQAAATEPPPPPNPERIRSEAPPSEKRPSPSSFAEVLELAGEMREMVLKAQLEANVHLVHFEPGRIEFRPAENAPPDLAGTLSKFLNGHTDLRWVVTVSREDGEPTQREVRAAAQSALEDEAASHPLVKAVLETFPGSEVKSVRSSGAKED